MKIIKDIKFSVWQFFHDNDLLDSWEFGALFVLFLILVAIGQHLE